MNAKKPRRFDDNLIVIGAGSAGLITSLIAATVKARVTLIERHRMGGDCLNTGCVPSKTLIRSAKAAHAVRTAHRYGVNAGDVEVDFPQVMARVRNVIATIAPNDSIERYTSLGVRCVSGDARLVDPWTVEVNGETRTARRIVLATGAVPVVPRIPGVEQVKPLTSDDVWSLTQLPRRLLVLGAGPIGCELAQSFQRLGSTVTLLDMEKRILPREDPEVSSLIAGVFGDEGVRVLTGHKAVRFEVVGGEKRLVAEHAASTGGTPAEVTLTFDEVLFALGRRAQTDSLGVDAIGIERNKDGTLKVDEYLRTTRKNILACGDLIGPYQFTHMASHQAWYAAVNALFGDFRKFKVNYDVVPWATYTEPEVARVGLSETEAASRGLKVEVTRHELKHVDRALTDGETNGFIKVLTRAGSDSVLGAVIVAPGAGELIGEYVTAMTRGIGLKALMGTIHVYPTLLEINKFAASAWRRNHAPQRLLNWVAHLHAFLRG